MKGSSRRSKRSSSAVRVSEGSSLEKAAGPGVLLGEGLARSIGATYGSLVTLIVNLPGGGVNALETPVVGIFYSATKAYDDLRVCLEDSSRPGPGPVARSGDIAADDPAA